MERKTKSLSQVLTTVEVVSVVISRAARTERLSMEVSFESKPPLAGPAVDIFMRGAKYAVHSLSRGERTTLTTLRYTGTVYTDGKSNNFFLNPVGVWSRFLEGKGWTAIEGLPSPASLLPYLNQFAHTYVEEQGRTVVQAASGVFLLDGSGGWTKIV